MKKLTFLCVTWLITTLTLNAATIEVTVTFDRGAPPAVLMWMPEDTTWKPTEPTTVDQVNQTFVPTIAVAPPGGTVRFTNSDTVQHNVFALDDERKINTDLGLAAPESVLTLTVAWPAGAVVKHGCKIHPQMQLWIASLNSSLHQVVSIPDGQLTATLRLKQVPITYTRVALWAPRIEALETTKTQGPLLRRGKPAGTFTVRRLPDSNE